jgi:hypothetical protein
MSRVWVACAGLREGLADARFAQDFELLGKFLTWMCYFGMLFAYRA